MQLIRWSQECGSSRVADRTFFDGPPKQLHLFSFVTRQMRVQPHGGGFSLKLVMRGREIYRFGARRVELRPGQFLLVESGRTYSSEIAEETESLSLFLPDKAASEIAAEACARSTDIEAVPIRFDDSLGNELRRLRDAVLERDLEQAEEGALLVAGAALAHSNALIRPDLLPRARRATREELLARVSRARDRILDQHGIVSLDQLSETACLSRFHFLRVYKEAFATTPLGFAALVRMKRAADCVRRGDIDAAIAAAGCTSKDAFRRAWRRYQRRPEI